ncbi:MAG TPA: glycosyltransferase family 2 protein [Methylibium sp.]|nr:glycosyltransferase family 2 protein [Methylibium sp.]
MNGSGAAAVGGARVLAVIVNYRTGPLVVNSLRALAAELRGHPGASVVVVDNDSGDGSAEVIAAAIEAEGWSAWARLERSAVNGGFSYGNNLAVRPALRSAEPPEFIWLLNPDTEVRPGALGALLAFVRSRPRLGIAGSSFEMDDGEPWPHAFRFPSLLGELAAALRLGLLTALLSRHTVLLTMGSRPERVDWLPGASMLIRREVFEQIGLMDEDYFLYYEETDFCLQAARAGWECWYVPASRVMHIAGQSTGVTGTQAGLRRLPAYWFESRRRYFVKNHGRAYAATTDVVWGLAFLLWRLRRWLQRKPDTDPPRMFGDLLRHSALWHGGLPRNARLARTTGALP